MAEADSRFGVETFAVGAAMGERGGHAAQQGGVDGGAGVRMKDAGQAAHRGAPAQKRVQGQSPW